MYMGLMRLAETLVSTARQDYEDRIKSHDFLSARMLADKDSRGLVGIIVGYATGDCEAMKKEVEIKIEEERSRYNGIKKLR